MFIFENPARTQPVQKVIMASHTEIATMPLGLIQLVQFNRDGSVSTTPIHCPEEEQASLKQEIRNHYSCIGWNATR